MGAVWGVCARLSAARRSVCVHRITAACSLVGGWRAGTCRVRLLLHRLDEAERSRLLRAEVELSEDLLRAARGERGGELLDGLPQLRRHERALDRVGRLCRREVRLQQLFDLRLVPAHRVQQLLLRKHGRERRGIARLCCARVGQDTLQNRAQSGLGDGRTGALAGGRRRARGGCWRRGGGAGLLGSRGRGRRRGRCRCRHRRAAALVAAAGRASGRIVLQH
mmetsp:Transcript_19091/g.49272  ORF Transcript_19091/g.49272 Transcript_19091/m.49272 type:complete len:222 (-) Transcript_19091:526-1191(-)